MSEVEKIATPRGDGRSMTSVSPYDISVNAGYPSAAPGEGADWFGPRLPMRPVAPPEVGGRQFDYQVGFNLNLTPRPFEAFDFRQLRNLADAFDPLRIILERRKDQMGKLPWSIRAKRDGDGKPLKAAQLSPQMRGTIKDIEAFFKHPCEHMSFRTWLRMLLEDLLVLDAPAIFQERDPGGNLVGLAPVDGGLIRPVIGDDGRIPRPMRWSGEPIMWNGAQITPANYAEIGCRIVNGFLYLPAYAQTLKGLPAHNYTTWDLLYRPMNLRTNSVFGRSPVEQIAVTISTAMRRAMSQLQYFAEGNQPDAIYGLPETFTADQTQRFQDYWDSMLSGNLANRRKMKFIPAGTGSRYTATKEPPLKNEFDEYLIRICCAALSYPPSAFVSLSNRSIAEQHERSAEEEGLEPLKAWFCELANEVIEREFSEDCEFAWEDEQDVDPKIQSEILSTYVESGVMTLNEAREKLGLDPSPNKAANELAAITATGYVPIGDVAKSTDSNTTKKENTL
jgi:hypothetical protein